MPLDRRDFLKTSATLAAAGGATISVTGRALATGSNGPVATARNAASSTSARGPDAIRSADRITAHDPWLEIDAGALRDNAREVARAAGGLPVLAVVKNNAYGLGLRAVGPIVDAAPEVAGLAVVTAEEAMTLRDAGVRKPILLMGLIPGDDVATDLVARGVRLAAYTDRDPARLAELARRRGEPIPIHLYIDTGMSRMGMPHHHALPWIAEIVRSGAAMVEGTFMTFTEDDEFDGEQLARFRRLSADARERDLSLGRWHAASSHALFFRPGAMLDMVRPGMALYGGWPAAGAEATGRAAIRPAFRLRAGVVRVQRLRPGDGVSYGHSYVADRPVWIATLPVGHADGYPRTAVDGCEVVIRGRRYPVIGAVSASHTIIEIGEEKRVEIGDIATLIGPDDPSVHPNEISRRADVSVYDVLMHLSARLPRRASPTRHSSR